METEMFNFYQIGMEALLVLRETLVVLKQVEINTRKIEPGMTDVADMYMQALAEETEKLNLNENVTMFDFEDGTGPVPAHKHENCEG